MPFASFLSRTSEEEFSLAKGGRESMARLQPRFESPRFFFQGVRRMAEVLCQKPRTVKEFKEIVEVLALELSMEVICGVMANFRHCCQAC